MQSARKAALELVRTTLQDLSNLAQSSTPKVAQQLSHTINRLTRAAEFLGQDPPHVKALRAKAAARKQAAVYTLDWDSTGRVTCQEPHEAAEPFGCNAGTLINRLNKNGGRFTRTGINPITQNTDIVVVTRHYPEDVTPIPSVRPRGRPRKNVTDQ